MMMSFGGKGGARQKKRGRQPAAAFGGEDEEDESKRQAKEVQRQRAIELGMSPGQPKTVLPSAAEVCPLEAGVRGDLTRH
jgi:hypothetical protein